MREVQIVMRRGASGNEADSASHFQKCVVQLAVERFVLFALVAKKYVARHLASHMLQILMKAKYQGVDA